jgi:DNA-binding CsgD family transcriptional regulator
MTQGGQIKNITPLAEQVIEMVIIGKTTQEIADEIKQQHRYVLKVLSSPACRATEEN